MLPFLYIYRWTIKEFLDNIERKIFAIFPMNDFSVSVLKKALQTLSHCELLELMVKLVEGDKGVKQTVIKNLQIPLQFIAAQPRNPQQIKNLK